MILYTFKLSAFRVIICFVFYNFQANNNRNKSSFKKREYIHGTRFLLKDLKWSRWELFVSPIANSSDMKSWTWTESKDGHYFYRRNHLFNKKTEKPALYEFGIQYELKKKIRPCYVRATSGFPSRYAGFWQSYLLRTPHVEDELSRCLRMTSFRFYVRRCVMTSPTSSATLLRKTYDYAWNKPHERHLLH